MKRLLAKSSQSPDRPKGAETLRGHTALVLASAEVLLRARSRECLDAAGLAAVGAARLSAIVRLSAITHDLGKCSEHFQRMVRQTQNAPQLVRHEAVSLWLCWPQQPLHAWLRPAVSNDLDYAVAVIAAAGHHRKFWSRAIAPLDAGAGTSMTLLTSHRDFTGTLELACSKLGIATPPALDDIELHVTRRNPLALVFEEWEDQAHMLIGVGTQEAQLLAVVKAFLVAADVAGSALPRGHEAPSWIEPELARRPSAASLRSVVRRRLGDAPLRPFQRAVGRSSAPVVLACAGCGTGKTLAAYEWAAEQHPGRQLWLTYPTTGTATEGFRDYVFESDLKGRLEHGRALVDIEVFGLSDAEEGTRDLDRLDAIRAWGCEVVTCTVDTVLGLVQNQRKGLYAWPGLAHGAVVFDEVHAYDGKLFGTLLRFLEALPGIPALLMTASLPGVRLRALRELCSRVHGRSLAEIAGPRELEALPRYRLAQTEDVWADVSACLSQGGKVLWVSNTVMRCLGLADAAADRGVEALVYHSRFRYLDRVRRHGEVIDAFRSDGPALALTTQVAEMSLDLSADLLVSDLAPVPAMIQRLGRLNRRSTPQRLEPVRPFVVLPFCGKPYEDFALDAARVWLDELAHQDLSQDDLVSAWKHDADTSVPGTASCWLDGRFVTEPDAVRDASPGIAVLLAEDAKRVRKAEARAVELALPMPPPPRKRESWRQWPRVGCFPVPPPDAIDYDPRRGARWQA